MPHMAIFKSIPDIIGIIVVLGIIPPPRLEKLVTQKAIIFLHYYLVV